METVIDTTKKQIEFYFSDSNLQKDRFLAKVIDENEEGCM